ncbi:MAG: hypothetical protein R3E96_01075 [Planctomycetota bacterium]
MSIVIDGVPASEYRRGVTLVLRDLDSEAKQTVACATPKSIHEVQPGRYVVDAVKLGENSVSFRVTSPSPASEGQTLIHVEVAAKERIASVILIDAMTGAPIPSGTVLSPLHSEMGAPGGVLGRPLTALALPTESQVQRAIAQGASPLAFSLEYGDEHYVAGSPGYAWKRFEVSDAATPCQVALMPAGSLVVESRLDELAGRFLEVSLSTANLDLVRQIEAVGETRFEPLPAGNLWVNVVAPFGAVGSQNLLTETLELQAGQELRVILTPDLLLRQETGRIVVRILRDREQGTDQSNGSPWLIMLESPGKESRFAAAKEWEVTQDRGLSCEAATVELNDLQPGSYQLQLLPIDLLKAVEVVAGQRQDVLLDCSGMVELTLVGEGVDGFELGAEPIYLRIHYLDSEEPGPNPAGGSLLHIQGGQPTKSRFRPQAFRLSTTGPELECISDVVEFPRDISKPIVARIRRIADEIGLEIRATKAGQRVLDQDSLMTLIHIQPIGHDGKLDSLKITGEADDRHIYLTFDKDGPYRLVLPGSGGEREFQYDSKHLQRLDVELE